MHDPGIQQEPALIILLAERVREQQELTVRRDAWYAKERVTFSDTLAMVWHWLWAEQHLQLSQTEADMLKVPRALYERFTETLCYAASRDKVELRLYCGCTGDRASIVFTSSLGVVASWCHSVHDPSYIATLSYPCKYRAIATPAAETPPPHVATRWAARSTPISWK